MEELTLEEAENLIAIDKNDLDTICQIHPEIFHRIAKSGADMKSLRDEAKETLQKVEATESLAIRTQLDKVGEKATEVKISQLLQLSERREKAVSRYLNAKAEAEAWLILKETFLERAFMLKNLCDLHGQSYFTTTTLKSSSVQQQSYENLRQRLKQLREGD